MRPLRRLISRKNLRHNLGRLREQARPRQLMAVLKANGYGHGVHLLREELESVPLLAVASMEEALELRALAYRQRVLLLEGLFHREEVKLCLQERFIPLIHNLEQLHWLKGLNTSTMTPLEIWFKFDSGMHRLGFSLADLPACQRFLRDEPQLRLTGLVSHFSRADEPNPKESRRQLAAIEQLLQFFPGRQRSFSNSAALFNLDGVAEDYARPGLALYGMSPLAGLSAAQLNLRPVMSLTTEIIALRELQAGDRAGYGGDFVAPAAGHLATIALGYGDGFRREIVSGRPQLLVNGQPYPLVGRVAMDMSLLWLGSQPQPLGSVVTVFGADNPAENLAAQLDTIPYTLTSGLTARVPLVAVD